MKIFKVIYKAVVFTLLWTLVVYEFELSIAVYCIGAFIAGLIIGLSE